MDKFIDLLHDLNNKTSNTFSDMTNESSNDFKKYSNIFEDIKEKDLSNIREEFFKLKNTDFTVNGVYEIINIYLIDINNCLYDILEVYNIDINSTREIIKEIDDICNVIFNLVERFRK